MLNANTPFDRPHAVIRTEALRKEYAGSPAPFLALDNVSLSINRGEMVAITGPVGSGKSTLMTLMGLLDVPTNGRYWLDGVEVSSLSRLEQTRVRSEKLGFVFENPNLLPRLSAQKNVELPLVYGRLSPRERTEKARAALAAVGLHSKLNSRPNELSAAQQQRVAIARALVSSPSVILADEPTGALDARTGAEIMALFRQLNREQGLTIVLVTHDLAAGPQLDRVIGLRNGHITTNTSEERYNGAHELPAAWRQQPAFR